MTQICGIRIKFKPSAITDINHTHGSIIAGQQFHTFYMSQGQIQLFLANCLKCCPCTDILNNLKYRSGTVNSNTVNSKFHLIGSYCEIFFYHFPNISCLKCTVNSNSHIIRSKSLLTNDFELTVPDLYILKWQRRRKV